MASERTAFSEVFMGPSVLYAALDNITKRRSTFVFSYAVYLYSDCHCY